MRKYELLVRDCDLDIRTGKPRQVTKRLANLNLAKVPAEWRLPLARICRRAGLYPMGMRLLTGAVLAEGEPKATVAELAEYSVLLLRSGALSEAFERLQELNAEEVPEVLLYRAFAHFSVWEYQAAIPLLNQYLQHQLSDYARLVGHTNLAFAYAETRNDVEAMRVLANTLRDTEAQGLRQLQSTCYTLRAQVHLQRREFQAARADLTSAGHLSDNSRTNDNMLAVKWGLILEGLESNSLEPFQKLRQTAVTEHSWESCREADFYSLCVKANRERFVHLYFGTPFPEFRNLMFAEFGDRPTQHTYVLGKKTSPRLDLATCEIDGRAAMVFGGKIHQLFELLLRDFYQPLRIAGLFSELFRGEHFNIVTSPGRVHQVLWRARRWLKDECIPVEIDESDGFFSLRLVGDFSFRVPLERISLEPFALKFEKLKTVFGEGAPFFAKDAQVKLGISKATLHELLKWGIKHRKIMRTGTTNRTAAYRILSSSPLKNVS